MKTQQQINEEAEARAAKFVELRNAGATFKAIGDEMGVSMSRAREIYLKGVRIAKRGPRPEPQPKAEKMPEPFLKLAGDLSKPLADDLIAQGFHRLSARILNNLWKIDGYDRKKPETVTDFADLLIKGAGEERRWRPFNGNVAIEALAWAEPRGSGSVTISKERRAQMAKAAHASDKLKLARPALAAMQEVLRLAESGKPGALPKIASIARKFANGASGQ